MSGIEDLETGFGSDFGEAAAPELDTLIEATVGKYFTTDVSCYEVEFFYGREDHYIGIFDLGVDETAQTVTLNSFFPYDGISLEGEGLELDVLQLYEGLQMLVEDQDLPLDYTFIGGEVVNSEISDDYTVDGIIEFLAAYIHTNELYSQQHAELIQEAIANIEPSD